MRAYCALIFILLSLFANANNIRTIKVEFDVKDFLLQQDESGFFKIISDKQMVSYGDNVSEPCLPHVSINVAVPNGSVFQNVSFTGTKHIFKTNVLMAPNPEVISTNAIPQPLPSKVPAYKENKYPSSAVEYVSTNASDGYTFVSLSVSPFEYNVISKELRFYDTLSIQLSMSDPKDAPKSLSPFIGKNTYESIRQIVVNPEDLMEYPTTRIVSENSTIQAEAVDYLIITSESLKSSFDNLVKWKRTKGVRTKVISVQDITSLYPGNSIQKKIKECLYDYYNSRGLKYVLLGGDNTVVPVQLIYANVGAESDSIPSDLYYACFGNPFDWDGNGNGKIGEVSDHLDFAPSVYVSRLPIRTNEHVISYITKLINYEKFPLSKPWHDNILMAGVYQGRNIVGQHSDAEMKAENLYTNYIRPYWTGSRVRFFDTYTDFTGCESYQLTPSNLQTQLQKGYTFFEMGTHGQEKEWSLENHTYYYDTDASCLQNEGFTLITTTACYTNAFDSSFVAYPDPCLSEAFIRNPNSGVVAYLGCSRQGWTTTESSILNYSYAYEKEFYKQLFNSSSRFRNYAEVVATVKMRKISDSNIYPADRWIQLGLNPVGDPEMPIYTYTPIEFENCIISSLEEGVAVNTGTDSCTICVMSVADDGGTNYEVRENVNSAVFTNINKEVSVCITKHNYVPKILTIRPNINIQNETISDLRCYEADRVQIGSHVTDTKAEGMVTFEAGKTKVKANIIKLMPKTLVKKGAQLIITNN